MAGNAVEIPLVIRHGLMMRKFFNFKRTSAVTWFPGHMQKGTSQIHNKLGEIDCVVEVHDARLPISGRNPFFYKEVGVVKPHILVFNKADLISEEYQREIYNFYVSKGTKRILFTNSKNPHSYSVKKLKPMIVNTVQNSERFNRTATSHYGVMILGVPNVGKSSIINALRWTSLGKIGKGKATSVGAIPGITQSVLERIKISKDPLIFVRDTPGIMIPGLQNVEIGLKLALVNVLKDHIVGEELIADYLLYKLNECGNHKYVDLFRLPKPTDDIREVLTTIAIRKKKFVTTNSYNLDGRITNPDTKFSAGGLLFAYREGDLGQLKLDKMDEFFDV